MTTDTLRDSLAAHESFVRRIARALTHDWNEAEDLVQETWAHALERQPDPSQLMPWLAATVRGLGRNWRRGERRRVDRELRAARPEAQPNPTDILILRQEVVEAVLRLKEPYQTTIVLAYSGGLSPVEISRRQGLSAATVRSRLHRAHALLEQDLGTREDRGSRYALLAIPVVAGTGGGPSFSIMAQVWVAMASAAVTLFLLGPMLLEQDTDPLSRSEAVLGSVPSIQTDRMDSEAGVGVELVSPEQERAAKQRQPARPSEHPFWVAVREARQQSSLAAPPRTPADARVLELLDRPLESSVLSLPATDMTRLVRSLVEPLGIPFVVQDRASLLGSRGLGEVEWIRQGPTTRAVLLDLISALAAGGEVAWEVRGGTLHVGTWSSLSQVDRVHPIADLLLRPVDYFAETPPELFEPTILPQDLVSMIRERLGFSQLPMEVGDAGIRIVTSRRAQRAVASYLDDLRSFWLPLPEKGRPGRTVRIQDHSADQTVIDEVLARGGVHALVPRDSVAVEQHLEEHLAGSRVRAVLLARARLVAPEQLRFSVRAGHLWVHDAEHSSAPWSSTALLMDLRTLLKEGPQGPLSEGHPLIEQAFEEGQALELKHDSLSGFLRRRIAPGSWDQDPANVLRLSQDGRLFVAQSPWVVEEIHAFLQVLQTL